MPLSDESYHPSLTYTSVNSVALGVGVIASIGDDFMVGKGDWANFWRQFRRARSEWFGQIYSVSSKGLILDYSLIFGDASAPSNGSRTEFILVSLIRHKLLAKLFPTDGSSCTIEWLSPNVRRWQSKRRAAFELSGEYGPSMTSTTSDTPHPSIQSNRCLCQLPTCIVSHFVLYVAHLSRVAL